MFHQRNTNNATGLNYLVHAVGPALIGRSIALRAQSSNDTVVDNGDDDGDGDGDNANNDVAVPERKRKRKLVDEEKMNNDGQQTLRPSRDFASLYFKS
jgi:hypothetical protein